MKKTLIIFTILLILGGATYFVVMLHLKTQREATAFVVDTVNAMSEKWDAQELVRRADPGLINAMASQGQGVGELFDIYRKLGNLKTPVECHLKDTAEFEDYTSASITCDAEYDNGPANFLMTIRRGKTESDWIVYYINVSSPHCTEQGYQRTK